MSPHREGWARPLLDRRCRARGGDGVDWGRCELVRHHVGDHGLERGMHVLRFGPGRIYVSPPVGERERQARELLAIREEVQRVHDEEWDRQVVHGAGEPQELVGLLGSGLLGGGVPVVLPRACSASSCPYVTPCPPTDRPGYCEAAGRPAVPPGYHRVDGGSPSIVPIPCTCDAAPGQGHRLTCARWA